MANKASLAFRKIRSDVLGATQAVPEGRITTYGIVGDYLEVMARHVSYILAMLSEEERAGVLWYRVVGAEGRLSTKNRARLDVQIAALLREGHVVKANRVEDFEDKVFGWPQRKLVPGQVLRQAYSDPATPLLFPPKG